jgi:uncharacterized membrane protein
MGGVLYPLLVYFGTTILPSMAFVLIGLALIGMRLLALRQQPDAKIWKMAFLIAALALILTLFLDSALAIRAYPVIVSLSIASIFGLSLLYPPSLVERMARLQEPNLPPSGVIYTRRVTILWTVFLLANALISAATAVWGTLAQWTLWNGLVSYLLMGTLFFGEMIVRRMVRR